MDFEKLTELKNKEIKFKDSIKRMYKKRGLEVKI